MKTTKHGLGTIGLFAVLLASLASSAARADDIFVANIGGGTIGEYTTSGATVNAALVSGLSGPLGIAVSGSDLFVTNFNAGTIGEYNATTGAAVNASLVSGLDHPRAIAVSGSDLFVVNSGLGTIGEYTTSGATVNAALVLTPALPYGIAVSGPDVFVSSSNIFGNVIGEYTTAGATVNAALVSGLNPFGIAIGPTSATVPEPSSLTLLILGLTALMAMTWRRSRLA